MRALVLLDTFEHLVAAAPLVYALLLSSPATTLLVTSRSALRLRGEHEFPVPPLELPSETAAVSPDDIARWPATALFWERAQAVMPDLELDDRNAALVADICRKLDGLPLAIELAAARVKHLPLAAVRDQLEDRLQLLVGGPLDLPLRQRAIRDTVAWSHDLLGEEVRLFRRLSVFSGGWNLAAVESVCGPPSEVGEALGGVSALVDQSLVVLDRNHASARYRMLDVVREYAAQELLTAGETEEIGRRHALYYLALSEEAGPNLVRAGHQEWFARLDVERGNLRRAMAWAIERGETVLALRYTVALWRYWRQLGEYVEGRRWSEAAVGMPGEAPPSLRAKALGAAAALAWPQGDYDRMADLAAEAIDLARQSEDPMDVRDALTVKGMVAMGQGRYAEAVERFRECLAICRPLGLSWQLATSHLNLGTALMVSGSPEEAEATFEEGLRCIASLATTSLPLASPLQSPRLPWPRTTSSEPTAWLAARSPRSRNMQSGRELRRVWKPWRLAWRLGGWPCDGCRRGSGLRPCVAGPRKGGDSSPPKVGIAQIRPSGISGDPGVVFGDSRMVSEEVA